MTTSTAPRVVHIEHCMGTTFTMDIRDPGTWDGAIADVVRWLHHVDAVFSTYRSGSDLCRIQRGELRLRDADPDVGPVLALCADLQLATDGAFSAMLHGRIDPTGLVKGWAIERASQLLRGWGSDNHAVNGGGDVQLAGDTAPGRRWAVGISDPHDRSRIVATVTGRDFAVATSGTAERGPHILDPATGQPAATVATVASASVTGPSLTFADAYATAAFVMGPPAAQWMDSIDGYDTMLVGTVGARYRSSAWPSCADTGL